MTETHLHLAEAAVRALVILGVHVRLYRTFGDSQLAIRALGVKLIELLARQLDGEARFEMNDGTRLAVVDSASGPSCRPLEER